jgi:hypothetical protein
MDCCFRAEKSPGSRISTPRAAVQDRRSSAFELREKRER